LQALTTFRDLDAQDFDFLPSLEELDDLELGDCSEWDTEVCRKYRQRHAKLENNFQFVFKFYHFNFSVRPI